MASSAGLQPNLHLGTVLTVHGRPSGDEPHPMPLHGFADRSAATSRVQVIMIPRLWAVWRRPAMTGVMNPPAPRPTPTTSVGVAGRKFCSMTLKAAWLERRSSSRSARLLRTRVLFPVCLAPRRKTRGVSDKASRILLRIFRLYTAGFLPIMVNFSYLRLH